MNTQQRADWEDWGRDARAWWAEQTCPNCDTQGEWDETEDGAHECRNCGERFEDAE